MAAPSMKERQACWGARDEYWKCLDENREDASKCKKLRSSFESSCPQQWMKNLRLEEHKKAVMEDIFRYDIRPSSVSLRPPEIKYFDKRRDYLKFKEKFEAGDFQPSKMTAQS